MRESRDRLRQVLSRPELITSLQLSDWDLLVRQARRSGLLARLSYHLQDAGILEFVPLQPRHHLEAERILAEKHGRDVRVELGNIQEALAEIDVPIVLLKGAAYLLADLPASRGRMFSDIDIMIPIARIAEVECTLLKHGWSFNRIPPYDDRYYRLWMHQIPPLTHLTRYTTVDVHHTIVARTTRIKLDAQKLFDSAVQIRGDRTLKVLAPADMVLHSATHLLNEGEFGRGLRDLDDLNQLLRHFGRNPDFWPTLVARARLLDLTRPLFYALRYTAMMLGTPVPEDLRDADYLSPPNFFLRELMDMAFERALRPSHASTADSLSSPALWFLYLRAHFLLMPLHILVPHLTRKAYSRIRVPGNKS